MATLSVKTITLIVSAIVVVSISTIAIISQTHRPESAEQPVIANESIGSETGDENLRAGADNPEEISRPGSEPEKPCGPSVSGHATISGRVLSPTGEPAARVTVMAQWYRRGDNARSNIIKTPQSNTTAPDGSFTISGLSKRWIYDLKANADGYAETIVSNIDPDSRNVVITLAPEATISGTVFYKDTEEVAKNVTVKLADTVYRSKFLARESVSDEDGKYSFGGLPVLDTYQIYAQGNKLISDPVNIKLEKGTAKEGVDLYLLEPLAIAGRVVIKGTDNPIEGIKLSLSKRIPPNRTIGTGKDTTSDTNGLFAFSGLLPGKYNIFFRPQGNYYRHGMERNLEVTLSIDYKPDTVIVELLKGKSLSGRIVNNKQKPIGNIDIRPFKFEQGRYRSLNYLTTRSDENGEYNLSALPIDSNEFLVRFSSKKDYSTREHIVRFDEDETEKELDVVLDKGLALSGIVTDSKMAPISDVQIWLTLSDTELAPGLQPDRKVYRTNTNGKYYISGLTPGTWHLLVQKEGYAPQSVPNLILRENDLSGVDFVLEKGGAIAGKIIIGDNTPLARAKVSFRFTPTPSSAPTFSRDTVTDEDGEFIIKGVGDEVYDIFLFASYMVGTPQARNLRKTISNVVAGTDDLLFQFDGFGSISGQVVDEDTGEPVTSFEINPHRTTGDRVQLGWSSFHSEEGDFMIENLLPEKYKLQIKSRGYAEHEISNILVDEGENTEGIIARLQKAYTLSGVVVMAGTQTPVSDVTLLARENNRSRQRGGSGHTISDDGGKFEIGGLQAGTYELRIESDKNIRLADSVDERDEYLEVTVTPDRPMDDVIVEVVEGKTLHGMVTDEDGTPLSQVHTELEIYSRNHWRRLNARRTRSSEDGHYKIGHLPMDIQEFRVQFSKINYTSVSQIVKFSDNETKKELDVVLKSGLTVSGTITDVDFNPIEKVYVVAYPRQRGQGSQNHSTDARGNYQLQGLTEGVWRLRIRKDGYIPIEEYELVIGDDDQSGVNFVLKKGVKISGKVFVEHDKPLRKQRIHFDLVSESSRPRRAVVTGNMGEFVIADIEEGIYQVSVNCRYPEGAENPGRLQKTVSDVPTGTTDLVFRFGGFGAISGRVYDSDSSDPIKRFRISKQIQLDAGSGHQGREQITSADGSFTVNTLQPGKYRLTFQAKGYADEYVENIVVTENDTVTDINVPLAKAGSVIGQVIDARTSEPIAEVPVRLFLPVVYQAGQGPTEEVFVRGSRTDERGNFVIEKVAFGTYRLNIYHQNYLLRNIEGIELHQAGSLDVGQIALDAGGTVEGYVTDELGNPLQGYIVDIAPPEYDMDPDRLTRPTNDKGYYQVKNVPPGTVQITVWWYARTRREPVVAASADAVVESGLVTIVNLVVAEEAASR